MQAHRIHRVGWLRASVLGANDGVLSTASLVIGVAAGAASRDVIILAGVAGAVAGALSMGAGEYVSVSSQADLEHADLELEREHQQQDPAYEHEELATIYRRRGLSSELASQVATALMAKDPLAAHARDELGINPNFRARPLKAALSSTFAFAVGACAPLLAAALLPFQQVAGGVAALSLLALAMLGALASYTAGASIVRGAFRVAFWGAGAMVVTAIIGALVGHSL